MIALITSDAWSWWQARRFRYNVALAIAGLIAYAAEIALLSVFHQLDWANLMAFASATLFLGILFLVLMGAANVAFLLGPLMESLVRPADLGRFRRVAFAMGYWGSFALPFVFPALTFAVLLGSRPA